MALAIPEYLTAVCPLRRSAALLRCALRFSSAPLRAFGAVARGCGRWRAARLTMLGALPLPTALATGRAPAPQLCTLPSRTHLVARPIAAPLAAHSPDPWTRRSPAHLLDTLASTATSPTNPVNPTSNAGASIVLPPTAAPPTAAPPTAVRSSSPSPHDWHDASKVECHNTPWPPTTVSKHSKPATSVWRGVNAARDAGLHARRARRYCAAVDRAAPDMVAAATPATP